MREKNGMRLVYGVVGFGVIVGANMARLVSEFIDLKRTALTNQIKLQEVELKRGLPRNKP